MRRKFSVVLTIALALSLASLQSEPVAQGQAQKFDVSFEIDDSHMMYKILYITVQNLQDSSDDISLKTILSDTDFSIFDVRDVEFSVWEGNSWKSKALISKTEDGMKGELKHMWEEIPIQKAGQAGSIKQFRFKFAHSVVQRIGGWGSRGVISLDLRGELFVDLTSSSWWNSNWKKQRCIDNLNPSDNQVHIVFDWEDMSLNDIRFLEEDNENELTFFVENYTSSRVSIWVERLGATDNSIWFYHDNPDASSASLTWSGKIILGAKNVPAGWVQESELVDKFLRGFDAYGGIGGSSSHTHTYSGSPSAGWTTYAGRSPNPYPPIPVTTDFNHSHSFSGTTGSSSHIPLYFEMIFVSKQGYIPRYVDNNFNLFLKSLPSGWTQNTDNGYYVRGANSYGGKGGSSTHTNSISGTTSQSGKDGYYTRPSETTYNSATGRHTHSYSGISNSENNDFPYFDVIVASSPSLDNLPDNILAIFTSFPPLGWKNVSDVNERLIRINDAYGGTGGSTSHAHSFSIVSDAPSETQTSGGNNWYVPSNTHTHTISGTTSEAFVLPPYINIKFGQRIVPLSVPVIGEEKVVPNIPTSLLTEGETSPQMLTTLTPEFSFNYLDNDSDNSKAARIQVGASPDDNSMWDISWSINVASGSTMTKTYAGSTLLRGVTYWWRARVQDNDDAWSSWSDSENFKIAEPIVENIWVDGENLVIDRDKDFALSSVDNITIWIQAHDNVVDQQYSKCFVTVKDNESTVLADNIDISSTYDNIDENTAKWHYTFNPPDDTSCNFCFVEVIVEDENSLGSDNGKVENLFRIDDKLVIVTVDETQYEEINIPITIKATTVSDGTAIENQQIVVTFYNPNNENRVELNGYTDENGEISIDKVLINEILGEWTVNARINVGENDNLDGMGSANFDLTGAVCRFVAITPYDDKITGIISSRLENSAELHLMLKVYDVDSVLVVEKLEDYSVGGGEQFHWEILYGVSLPEGTYSYSVRLWNYDYSAQYDSVFAEIRLTVAPTQQRVGDWVSVYTYEGKDGIFDVVLRRESTVTNSSLVDKSNFLFKEFVPAPPGSTVMVKVSGMPSSTLVVDKNGLITKNFDVDAGTTVMVDMEVTIVSAVKMEGIGSRAVVASVPRTVNEYEYTITNLTDTTLRELVLVFPIDGVVGVSDDDGKPLDFWESESTSVKIPILEPYGETTLTLSAETVPDLPEMLKILVKWKIWGIPILAIMFGLGVMLCWMGRNVFKPLTHLIALCMPTLVLLLVWTVGLV